MCNFRRIPAGFDELRLTKPHINFKLWILLFTSSIRSMLARDLLLATLNRGNDYREYVQYRLVRVVLRQPLVEKDVCTDE